MAKAIIIAGNARQAEDYRRERGLSLHEAPYVYREEQLFGLRDVTVIRTGEYWLNPVTDHWWVRAQEAPK